MIGTSKMVGGFEMYTKRVTNTSCVVMNQWNKFGKPQCYSTYSSSVEEKAPYGPFGRWKWSPDQGYGTGIQQGLLEL